METISAVLTVNFILASKGCSPHQTPTTTPTPLPFGSDIPAALAVISMQLVAPLSLPTRFLASENNIDIKKSQKSEQLCPQAVSIFNIFAVWVLSILIHAVFPQTLQFVTRTAHMY